MGMLMHHTWLEQRKKKEKGKAVESAPSPAPVAEEVKEEVPAKRTGGRRKTK